MGLLDKASDTGSKADKKPVAKAVAKAKPVAKAVAKAKPVAQVIDTPVAVTATNAKKVKAKNAKRANTGSQGLPANVEIATANSRRIAWFVNFVINVGPIIGFLFSVAILDAFTTIFALVALAALIFNLIIIPIMSGRTLGNFISRTKNIKSNGMKPNFIHALLVNSTGILALAGIVFLMVNAGSMFSEKGSAQIWASVWSILGLIFIVLFFVNTSMKSGSELNQGLYDSMFGAYLVKHVPAEGEVSTGFIGKLESLSSYGDRYNRSQEEKLAKKATKARLVEAEASNADSDSSLKSMSSYDERLKKRQEEKLTNKDDKKEDKKKDSKKSANKKSE